MFNQVPIYRISQYGVVVYFEILVKYRWRCLLYKEILLKI